MKTSIIKFVYVATIVAFILAIHVKGELTDATYLSTVIALCIIFYVFGAIALVLVFIYFSIDEGFKKTWDLFTKSDNDLSN